MRQYEYRIIVTGVIGVPQGEPDPDFEGGTVEAKLQAGLNDLGKEGWLFMMHLQHPARMVLAREVVGPPCERQACGNCRWWDSAQHRENDWTDVGFGECRAVWLRKDTARLDGEGGRLLTLAEHGCFSWGRRV